MIVVSPLNRSFDRFLYASALECEELPVSVLSVMARQGLDPWQEAIRLAGLPRDKAAQSLAEILRCGGITSPDAATKAAWRLVELLPRSRAVLTPHASEDPISLWLVFGIFIFMMSMSASLRPPPLQHEYADGPRIVTSEEIARASSDRRSSRSSTSGQPVAEGLSK